MIPEHTKEHMILVFKNWCNSPFSFEARKYHKTNAHQLNVLDTVTYPWINPLASFNTGFDAEADGIIANGGFSAIRVICDESDSRIANLFGDEMPVKITKEEADELYALFLQGCEGVKNKYTK